jgi:hypothetical protein
MRFSFFRHTRWTAFLTAGAIAACNTAPLVGNLPETSVGRIDAAPAKNRIFIGGQGFESGPVTLFAYNASNYKLKTTVDGVDNPAVSPNGNIFATEGAVIHIYDPQLKLIGTLTRFLEKPSRIEFGAGGTAYVLDTNDVAVFPNGSQSGAYKIEGIPGAIAVAPNNDVYIHHAGVIDIYAPGQKKPIKSIPDGASKVFTMLVDAKKNVYVAEITKTSSECGSVSVYNTSSGKLEYSIGRYQGVCYPLDIAIDSDKILYVLNNGNGDGFVSVYPLGQIKASYEITENLYMPSRLLVDPKGLLYVENYVRVAVFAPGQTHLYYTIEVPGDPVLQGIAYGR